MHEALTDMLPHVPGARFQRLGPADVPAVQTLFERCSEFFELTEGAPPGADTAAEEIALAAPGKTAEDTFCFGAFVDDRVIAFIHLARDFPKPSEWWLGFLLIDPAHRRRGFGVEVHEALTRWLVAQSASTLWLGVLTQNEPAHRFWLRMGYVERERQQVVSRHGLQSTVILMSQPLTA
ncbi:MAG TPA: GNAT family N-acetyltransferase [Thermoanaerobaculia bacterium]|nr:GNAT family N-acetyltransferase [Thermoanaerobaculia bacterium]